MKKLIVSLCDESGNWPKWYSLNSEEYEVVLVDQRNGNDVLFWEPDRQPYGVLAAPPCTMFSNAGARWERSEEDMGRACDIVRACLRICKSAESFWCLENPRGTLNRYVPEVGPLQMEFQPYEYAGWLEESEQVTNAYTKRTGLWGNFSWPTPKIVYPTKGALHNITRSAHLRSKTPLGFARAFYENNR